jgi:hypothetical protein
MINGIIKFKLSIEPTDAKRNKQSLQQNQKLNELLAGGYLHNQEIETTVANIEGLPDLLTITDMKDIHCCFSKQSDPIIILTPSSSNCEICVIWDSNQTLLDLVTSAVLAVNHELKKMYEREYPEDEYFGSWNFVNKTKIFLYAPHIGRDNSISIEPTDPIEYLRIQKTQEKSFFAKYFVEIISILIIILASIVTYSAGHFNIYFYLGCAIPLVVHVGRGCYASRHSRGIDTYSLDIQKLPAIESAQVVHTEKITIHDLQDPYTGEE